MPAFITEPLKLGFQGRGPSTTSHMMEESLSHRPPLHWAPAPILLMRVTVAEAPWLPVGAMTIKSGFHGKKNWIKPSYIFLSHRLSQRHLICSCGKVSKTGPCKKQYSSCVWLQDSIFRASWGYDILSKVYWKMLACLNVCLFSIRWFLNSLPTSSLCH